MNNVFTNVAKKHTKVWQKSILLPDRFVYQDPNDPNSQEQEEVPPQEEQQEQVRLTVDTKKLESIIRKKT
jgi:hypothetical protein